MLLLQIALMTLEAQLRRCHKSLICDEGKWHIAAHLHLRMKRGASVKIQTEHGIKIEKMVMCEPRGSFFMPVDKDLLYLVIGPYVA